MLLFLFLVSDTLKWGFLVGGAALVLITLMVLICLRKLVKLNADSIVIQLYFFKSLKFSSDVPFLYFGLSISFFKVCYRPQRSYGKVMFLHLSVILLPHPLGRHPSPGQTPGWADTPLADIPQTDILPAQCMLGDVVRMSSLCCQWRGPCVADLTLRFRRRGWYLFIHNNWRSLSSTLSVLCVADCYLASLFLK